MTDRLTQNRTGAGGALNRLLCLGGFLFLSAIVTLPRLLAPSPSGTGTHLQLGMRPCGLLLYTGIPCPTCGATTAFSLMARGEALKAARANLFASVLYLCLVVVAFDFLVCTIGGAPPFIASRLIENPRAPAICLFLLLILSWIVKLITLAA